MGTHRKRSCHLELGRDSIRIGGCFNCRDTLDGRSREHVLTNGSTGTTDDLALREDSVPEAVGLAFVAPGPLEIQPVKVTGECVGVRERDDRVLRVPVKAAVRGDVLQLEDDRVDVGEGASRCPHAVRAFGDVGCGTLVVVKLGDLVPRKCADNLKF